MVDKSWTKKCCQGTPRMCPLSWVSCFSAGDDFLLHSVPCWRSTVCDAAVEQPYSLLWLKQQLPAWDRWTWRPAWRHCTANSQAGSRSELLSARWPRELCRWRRSSTSDTQIAGVLEMGMWNQPLVIP